MLYLSTKELRTISICSINYSPEGIYHPDRTMNEYDLLYMQSGSWDIYENSTCYHIEKGDLLILEPGAHHYSLEKCSPQMRNMFIHCSALPEDGLMLPENLCLPKITNCSGNPQIEQLFLQILETHWSQPRHAEFKLGTLLNLLFSELEIQDNNSILTDSLIKDIIHQFRAHTYRFYSPQELAQQYQISIRSLSGRFKKATGASIHQYQLNLKLNLAHEQLQLYPNRGLRDIALSLGFYDEFHFSKLFKRQFGYSPSECKY